MKPVFRIAMWMKNDLFGLLQDFEILSMNKEINYVRKGKGTHGVHFYVHVAKK